MLWKAEDAENLGPRGKEKELQRVMRQKLMLPKAQKRKLEKKGNENEQRGEDTKK